MLHSSQWQFLKSSFELDKLPHALLFAGPEGAGKSLLALKLCRLILCFNEKEKPCDNCFNCSQISAGSHPDVIFIKPFKEDITINQIRELSWQMSLRPLSSSWKIAVLEKAHLMPQEAQNAFLKTLEEPYPNRLFVLTSEYPSRLLPTVISRVQKIVLKPLPKSVLEKFLSDHGASKKESVFVAGLSKGLAALALEFLKNKEKLSLAERELKRFENMSERDLAEKFSWAKELAEKPTQDITEILRLWLFYFHGLLLKEKNTAALKKLKLIIENIEKTQALLKFTNINTRLTLEVLLLEL